MQPELAATIYQQINRSNHYSLWGIYSYSTGELDMLENAAESGNDDAMFLLGEMSYNKTYDKRYQHDAIYWYSKAAEKNNTYAMTELGICYLYGIGFRYIDESKALHYLNKSADKGHDKAQYIIGMIYYYGIGIAFEYDFITDLDFGVTKEHLYNMKREYWEWQSQPYQNIIETNRNVAIRYLQLAADQEHYFAKQELKEIYIRENR